jgi:hypothetical protein
MPQDTEQAVLEQYLEFCANPLRGPDVVRTEYETLVHHPRVVRVGFYNPDIMMIGTDSIIVTTEDGLKRVIGQMILFFIRREIDGYWEVSFRIGNVTHPITIERARNGQATGNSSTYVHPHVVASSHEEIEFVTGNLCINQGQFSVYTAMRKGEMHVAAPRLIEILEVYPTGCPYHGAEAWPVTRKEKHDA